VLPAPDLKSARVYYTVMGDEAQRVKCEAAVRRSAAFIQKNISRRMTLRYTPRLSYFFDTTVAQESKIMKLLDGLVPGERREFPAADDAAEDAAKGEEE
jgi:ribosome-binding factor A